MISYYVILGKCLIFRLLQLIKVGVKPATLSLFTRTLSDMARQSHGPYCRKCSAPSTADLPQSARETTPTYPVLTISHIHRISFVLLLELMRFFCAF